MKLHIVFLLPAVIAGYLLGKSLEDHKAPTESPALVTSAAKPAKTPPPPAVSPEPKLAPVAVTMPDPSPHAVSDAFGEKTRVPRLLMILDIVSNCDKKNLKANVASILEAFDDGLLEKSDLMLILEQAGTRCDRNLMVELFSTAGTDQDLQSSLFKGWAGIDPKGAVESLAAGDFQIGKGKLRLSAIQGIVLGTDPDSNELEKLRAKFPEANEHIDYWTSTSSARRSGLSHTLQGVLKLPMDPEATATTTRIAALGNLASATSESTFLKYVDQAVKGETDIGINIGLVAKLFSDRDYTQSFNYGLGIPPGDNRSNFLSSTIFQAGLKNPDDAIKLVAEMPAGSNDEQRRIIRSLENAFRQSPAVSKEELPDLMQQTQSLQNSLKSK